MKLSSLGLILLGSTSLSSVYAGFHIGRVTTTVGVYRNHIACPSSKYNCDCFKGQDGLTGTVKLPKKDKMEDFFQITTPNWCGRVNMPTLDFYKRADGHWDFYRNKGDGTRVGTCYANSDSKTCIPGGVHYGDKLACYTDLCN
ncbi:hypothetical protein FA13DRAFT_1863518 [Coprinellus micaceus]|uniref:Secreted protein n=1 Tax=Coprinellus micaceus TaxID=71717 RepID=A0A4Y7SAS2_COPMI|nr:hypothetical protein FA13DRAFT_1860234 [Coprinellus micaceus]TEB29396.1 hypothetical protein FA13DRAFT_1863518 [Coprinellus micaceus]